MRVRTLSLLLVLLLPLTGAVAQQTEVTLEVNKTAFQKIDLLVNMLDVLSGGMASVQTADQIEDVVISDLNLSGLFRVGINEAQSDSFKFEYTIEGTVEGPLRDAAQTGESVPTTISLNLLTWPGRQLVLNKRYRPMPDQVRATAHHFADQVMGGAEGDIFLDQVVCQVGRQK